MVCNNANGHFVIMRVCWSILLVHSTSSSAHSDHTASEINNNSTLRPGPFFQSSDSLVSYQLTGWMIPQIVSVIRPLCRERRTSDINSCY